MDKGISQNGLDKRAGKLKMERSYINVEADAIGKCCCKGRQRAKEG